MSPKSLQRLAKDNKTKLDETDKLLAKWIVSVHFLVLSKFLDGFLTCVWK